MRNVHEDGIWQSWNHTQSNVISISSVTAHRTSFNNGTGLIVGLGIIRTSSLPRLTSAGPAYDVLGLKDRTSLPNGLPHIGTNCSDPGLIHACVWLHIRIESTPCALCAHNLGMKAQGNVIIWTTELPNLQWKLSTRNERFHPWPFASVLIPSVCLWLRLEASCSACCRNSTRVPVYQTARHLKMILTVWRWFLTSLKRDCASCSSNEKASKEEPRSRNAVVVLVSCPMVRDVRIR